MIGAMTMIAMSSHYLVSEQTVILRKKEIASSLWYLLTFRSHIFFGLIAITAGPSQFITCLRTRYRILHKVIGYLYVTSVLISSTAGLIIAPFAMGGLVTSIGFSVLSISWFGFTINSLLAIRNGDINIHKKWAFISYALTFSSITQRTLLLIPLLTDIPFTPIYQLSAWLPWLINLALGNWLYNRYSR